MRGGESDVAARACDGEQYGQLIMQRRANRSDLETGAGCIATRAGYTTTEAGNGARGRPA